MVFWVPITSQNCLVQNQNAMKFLAIDFFLRSSVPCFYGVVTAKDKAAGPALKSTSCPALISTSRRPATRTRPSVSPTPPFTSQRASSSTSQSQRTVAVSNTPPSNLGGSLSSNSLTSSNGIHPTNSHPTDNIDVGLNSMSGQIPIHSPSLPPFSDTHPDGLSPPDKDGESNKDESKSDKSDDEYAPDAEARESSDDSEDMTPQPLDDDSGVDANDGAVEDTDFVGGGFMGEGDYAVEEFSIQQRIMHFPEQRIDKQNRFNVEICLLLEAGSSVSDERATTSNLRNDMMMNRYVNLICNFEVENFVDPAIQEDMALHLYNSKKQ